MKIVFISNYFNHHQKPFSDCMYNLIGDNYSFIETQPIEEERLKMGWGGEEKPSYVKRNYIDENSHEECKKIIDDADVVIFGSAPYGLLKNRLKQKKLTIFYSERIYKKSFEWYKYPLRLIRHYLRRGRYKNTYLLCASAYAASDYSKTFLFLNRAYKWGYFPEVKRYDDIDKIIREKKPNSILWTARLIDWKHPELAIAVAKRLKQDGYNFKLTMIGVGELEEDIKILIKKENLTDYIEMAGAMTPEQVREYMEKSEIFLFTSDRNEGWGAVLNESMNSACAVVASHAIGSVPFLIQDEENGLIYRDGDIEDLYKKVKRLLDCPTYTNELGENAYRTMIEEWNAENATNCFLELVTALLERRKGSYLKEKGVCSKAAILRDNWFKN